MVDNVLGWRPGFEKGKDPFNFVNSKYKLSNSDIVFIGDSVTDARRARTNNIYFLEEWICFKKIIIKKSYQKHQLFSLILNILE